MSDKFFKLPNQAKNPIRISIKSSQIDKNTDKTDPRIFGKDTFNILYGPRFTGKSVLISNLIEDHYIKTYKSILILTPSLGDKAWNNIRQRKRVCIFNKCTNDLLFDLLQEQENLVLEGKPRAILLVIDDFACQGKALKALEELSVRGRHAKITVILTAQYSRLLSPVIRQNANGIVLFKLSDSELKNLAEEGLKSLVSTEEFVNWVKEHTQKPQDFVYINLRNPNRVFNIGFSDPN